jgi:hypothetical protein
MLVENWSTITHQMIQNSQKITCEISKDHKLLKNEIKKNFSDK